ANNGDILWQYNIDEVRVHATMSKAMSLYLVFDALSKGEIKEDTVITAKPTDEAIANIYEISNNKIVSGVKYTVSELITMTAVPSSNAATVMLANYLSDNDPDKWIDRMNEKSKELGMTDTKWYNASGAGGILQIYYTPKRCNNNHSNQTTARDLSIMAYNLIKHHPEIINTLANRK
ncbi:MAG: D-alanyl-D-alanine carboxypeptidase family protein, partial [Streptococcus salivarius]